ncbi:MAG TPA: 5'/3'-nucleotidase SurE [Candidatus Melainabacteria bacterium]|nr:5'/3'-nucleotidase SurE [Candidatus Melainabacteria bacterium]
MRILLSNDDGITAPGIRTLAERLSRDSDNEVYVVAPDRERSATGHCLTLHKPLRVTVEELPGKVKKAWSTTGTPSDSVKLAVSELLPEKPDLVISGINNGPNLGSEILYSGTVAAAMEAAFMGLPSIAVSLFWGENRRFDVAAEFIAKLVHTVPDMKMRERSLLNINVPNVPYEEIAGVAITEAGIRLYDDRFERREDPRGKTYYWLTGHAVDTHEAETSDVHAVLHKKISITPVAFNMTDHQAVTRLSALTQIADALESARKSGKEEAAAK